MIIPGILEENFDEVVRKIKLVEEFSPTIQIDIIDNTIIQGKTFTYIQKIRKIKTKTDLTIHFMVEKPLKYLESSEILNLFNMAKIGNLSTVITQIIPPRDLEDFILFSKRAGYKIGLSMNADEDISLLQPYMDKLEIVQFMSVAPGKQGNAFIPSVLNKIKDFKNRFPLVTTQIDGGVNETTLPQVLETGVDNIVVGSAIFNSEDPKRKYLEFSKIFNERTAHGTK
jgi:ribulose-phosphate 3-epimerase